MARITVKISKSYNVHIGHGLIKSLGVYLNRLGLGKRIVLVTSTITNSIYGDRFETELVKLGYEVKRYLVIEGEETKNISEYFNLLNFLSAVGITRSDTIIGFGGSSVLDLAGFCAATYHRGIKFVSVPTSLVAMLENSVGGKTGLNLVGIRNLVGIYFYPEVVLCDLEYLKSLEEYEWENGLAELIKYSILIGGDFYQLLMSDNYKEHVYRLVEDVVAYKREIVEIDETDLWESHVLNLGYIFANAIRDLSSNAISYGRALAMGLNKIAYISYKSAGLQKRDYDKIVNLLKKYKLRLDLPFDLRLIIDTMKKDRNIYNDNFNVALINSLGRCSVEKIPFEKMDDFFD